MIDRARGRAFVYRGGVRLAGTVVACDAAAGTDLVFLSHAPALGAHGRRALPHLGSGSRQILATDVTLALLGPAGERMRRHALVAACGRPFSLGELRLELYASGFMPGAASLLCERGGRRLAYSGPIGAGPGVEVRAADALCLDARGAAATAPPPAALALAAIGQGVRALLADGRAPVLVAGSPSLALEVGGALAADRIALRGHRSIVQAAAAYRGAGLAAPPIARFDRRLAAGEVLLWPAGERVPGQRAGGRPPGVMLVGDAAGGPGAGPEGGPDAIALPFSERAGLAALVGYVEAAGASEIAIVNAPDGQLMRALQAKGLEAYAIGPPRQASLFEANAA